MLVQLRHNTAVLRNDGVYEDFAPLVAGAMKVERFNLAELDPDDRILFPVGDDGVAQGCPLSALVGHVALVEFDRAMNIQQEL